ncbi:MAG: hypothetical protein HYY44_07810 [Deltaproteobacteria bacterium]|nr:hypothetical protein [Deltaproteobacteria bacterium]
MLNVVAPPREPPSNQNGGWFEALKSTVHLAQATPGHSQFYSAVALMGLSLLAGGGRKLTVTAIGAGTLVGTLFSHWDEVSTAYRKGSGLTGSEVVTEGVSFAGQTALMIFAGFVGAPAGKVSSLLASNLARRINYRSLPLVSASIEKATRTAVQLFISGAGVYGFAVSTHLTSACLNRGLGQENAFHDFWGEANHLFFFMSVQQVIGLAGIGRSASSLAGKGLRWCGNTVAASVVMQTAVNPLVFRKETPASFTNLLAAVGGESRNLALLHLGGKAFPHALPIFRDAMRRWDGTIAENKKGTETEIHEARLLNEARWQNDPIYRHRVQMGVMTAGVALCLVTGNPAGAKALFPCSTVTTKSAVEWPQGLNTELAWNIYKKIVSPEEKLTEEAFLAEWKRPAFRQEFFDALGEAFTRSTLHVVWRGNQEAVRGFRRLYGEILANSELELACWNRVEETVPLWREIDLRPDIHFFKMIKAQADLEAFQKTHGEGTTNADLVRTKNRIALERIAFMVTSREVVMKDVTREQAQVIDETLAMQLSYLFLRRLNLETNRLTLPRLRAEEFDRPEFRDAYEEVEMAIRRVFKPADKDFSDLLDTAIREQTIVLEEGGGAASYEELVSKTHPGLSIPNLLYAGPRTLSLLYLRLVQNPPSESLIQERGFRHMSRELEKYREERLGENPKAPPKFISFLATAECIAKIFQTSHYSLNPTEITTDVDQAQIRALSLIVPHLQRSLREAIDRVVKAEPVAYWRRFSKRGLKKENLEQVIYGPIESAMTALWRKQGAKTTPPEIATQCRTLCQTLQGIISDVRSVTGIGPSSN